MSRVGFDQQHQPVQSPYLPPVPGIPGHGPHHPASESRDFLSKGIPEQPSGRVLYTPNEPLEYHEWCPPFEVSPQISSIGSQKLEEAMWFGGERYDKVYVALQITKFTSELERETMVIKNDVGIPSRNLILTFGAEYRQDLFPITTAKSDKFNSTYWMGYDDFDDPKFQFRNSKLVAKTDLPNSTNMPGPGPAKSLLTEQIEEQKRALKEYYEKAHGKQQSGKVANANSEPPRDPNKTKS
ncbi:hypothetical protein F5Y18DRAFT_430214 [Xylariaceae sp. FL1019]|nr:hypothetical protein F5Y18DRAFT_430214 [Xylariaceae sp. FL1019]